MKYAIEIGLGAVKCILSTINIGSGIQNLKLDIFRHTDRLVIS
jgi:hypothetical protein